MRELTLEANIAAWRQEIGRTESIDHSTVSELECHLRDAIDLELEGGATPDEAFTIAATALGDATQLDTEFHKIHGSVSWAKRLLWLVSGYALVQLSFHLILYGRLLVEGLTLRWFPGKMIELSRPIIFKSENIFFPIGGTVSHAHIAVFTGLAFILAAYNLVIWIGTRCIRGRSVTFDRWFAECSPWKLVSLVAVLPVLMFPSVQQFFYLAVPRGIATSQGLEDLALYGMSKPEHSAISWHFGDLLSNLYTPLWIGFTIWAVIVIRRQPGRHFVAWMFGGYVAMGVIHWLGGIGGGLAGAACIAIANEFATNAARVFSSPMFYSNAGLICLVTQVLIAAGLVIYAWLISSTGSAEMKTERLCRWVSRNAIALVLIVQTPAIVGRIFAIFDVHIGVSVINGNNLEPTNAEVLQSVFILPHYIKPWMTLAIAFIAGRTLLRERHGSSKFLERFVERIGLPLD